MMNTRFAPLAASIAMAVLSLALLITVVGGTASSVSDEAIGIESDAVTKEGTGNRPLVYQRSNISQDEALSLTEQISIYLPLLSTAGYIDKSVERAALMALYNSTNGDEWYNNTGWGTDTSFCEWYGVTCDENEHVRMLDLTQNGLTGTLPSEIGNLPRLTVLRLPGTVTCSGTKPPSYCEFYQLSDPLPPEIGNLSNLRELSLSYNRLTNLPAEIGGLVNLKALDLSFNSLTSLPPEIGNLTSLQALGLVGNQLDSLPGEIGNLTRLLGLNLEANKLTSLPAEIGNLTGLLELYLPENQLTELPPEIGNLVSLQTLIMFDNKLASLPPEIGNLVNLQVLDLNDNLLTSIPPKIGNLANLWWIMMTSNRLSGPIPAMLSNLYNLKYLELDGNPDLTCWETEEARDWALSLDYYFGPTCVLSQ